MVHTVTRNQIFIKDSLINNTEAISNYSLKIIDTAKYFTLLYANEPNSLDIASKSTIPEADTVINLMTNLIKRIEKESEAFKYELLVDKNTGLAFKVKNAEQFSKMITKLTGAMIAELAVKMRKSGTQVDSLKQKVSAHLKLAEPKIFETIVNQFNYLMQPYSYEFPYNKTISQKAMIQDVNALGTFGGIEMPATLTITSKKDKNVLTIQTDTDYDKDFLLEQIKKKYKNMSKLTASDIFMSEKNDATFAVTNGWINSHRSNVVFMTKEVKVVNETLVTFK